MAILKVIEGKELYLYMNGNLIYKRWLDTGQSKVFDVMAYDKYTLSSYKDRRSENEGEFLYVKAKLKLITPEDGGRTTPIASGYRPDHVFEYEPNKTIKAFIGDLQFDGMINLGEEKIVMVRFLLHQPIERYIQTGRRWLVHEGKRVIGEATIID